MIAQDGTVTIYCEETVIYWVGINLEASHEEEYHFFKWKGDNGTMTDVYSNVPSNISLDDYLINAEVLVGEG